MRSKTTYFTAALLLPLALHLSQPSWAEEVAAGKSMPLADFKKEIPETRLKPSPGVSVARSQDPAAPGLLVTIQPGNEQYPGFHLAPEAGTWDLSEFGHIRARIVNTGSKALNCSLRVDGKAEGAEHTSNTESVKVEPGQAGTVKVIFGFSYGSRPASRPSPAAISNLVIFAQKSDVVQSFRIESVEASGPVGEKPPVKPGDVRVKPEKGVILGAGVTFSPNQLEPKEGALAEIEGTSVKLTFPPGKKPQWVLLKPSTGRWDLRDAFEVKVKLKNTGATAVTPKVRVGSNAGPTDVIASSAPVAPGAEAEIAVPFAPAVPWQGIKDLVKTSWDGQPGTGTKFTNDAVGSVTISLDPGDAPRSLLVSSVVAGASSPPPMPDWVGKRPPVEGDWVMTFQEEFDQPTLDESKWRIYTENHWDKRSHFSKENVIMGGGVVKLHYAKKTGPHNDDPNGKVTDYATGFLDTYGKWVQRYGYFEARMKLTTAPGLWPAFWLMPDRGVEVGPQWKRQATEGGGMEFDIMEFLGRWGPYRYNIAWHWDGYQKNHKQTGTTTIYFQPDKEGFITAGVLWVPGLSVYYANGKEVARWESPRISDVQSDIMFTNVSGGWDNNAIDDSKLPDDFVIDYVRAWQRKDLASAVDGKKSEAK